MKKLEPSNTWITALLEKNTIKNTRDIAWDLPPPHAAHVINGRP